jgi:hypothetical protein
VFLVRPGTPAAIDEELDPVAPGISRSPAQGSEEGGVELDYTRNLVIKDRRVVGDGTINLAKRPRIRTRALAGRDLRW